MNSNTQRGMIVTALIICLLFPFLLIAQIDETTLDEIRREVIEINQIYTANHDAPKVQTIIPEAIFIDIQETKHLYKTLNGKLTTYLENNDTVILIADYQGTHADLQSIYYFKNGNLIYNKKTLSVFHHPLAHPKHDKSEISTNTTSYYFQNNSLVKYLDSKLKSISQIDPNYRSVQEVILSDAKLYQQAVSKGGY